MLKTLNSDFLDWEDTLMRKDQHWGTCSWLQQEEFGTWNLGHIPFETFQEEEYLEYVFWALPIPVQTEQKSVYSGIKVQSPSKSITTIPAILLFQLFPLWGGMDGIYIWNTLPVLPIPKNCCIHLLFLYSTSSYFEKLSKGMQSY